MNDVVTQHWPVWDKPVRFIHWYFPLAISFMWWTGEAGYMQWHSWCGYSLLVVTATRLSWGVIGSHYARFTQFIKTPATVWRYIRHGEFDGPGHNPLGGYSTLLMLLLLSSQGLTGLVSTDDILFDGPLAFWASQWAPSLGEWHEINWTILLCAMTLHVLAIVFYSLVKQQALVAAMWRGYAPGCESQVKPVHSLWAIGLAIFWAAILAAIVAWAPQAPSYY